MLRAEARWLRRELSELPVERLTPLLSIGSGDEAFRSETQPWIAEEVFDPLVARGVKVVHHEHLPSRGVDIAGDLTDSDFLDALRALAPRTILCCSVLEHMQDRDALAGWMSGAIGPGGLLVVTVPRHFPYHPDPIDSLYRPSISELQAACPDLTLRCGDEIACGTLLEYFLVAPRKTRRAGRGLQRIVSRRGAAVPAAQPGDVDPSAGSVGGRFPAIKYLFRKTSMTCAVFERCT
jgi:hypothetical protein